MAKQNPNKKQKDSEDTGITVTAKPDFKGAPETIPDQEILKKPKPKAGMKLLESWNHPTKFKK